MELLDNTIDRIDAWQRRVAPVAFGFGVVKKFGEDQAGRLAALVAYYAFFSLMPLLLVFATILSFVLDGNPSLQDRAVDSALASYPVIGDQIEQNVMSIEGNGIALVVGIVVTLWAGLGAMNAAEQAFNSVWNIPVRDRPNFLMTRLRGLAMLVVIGGGILVSMAITSVSQHLHVGFGIDLVGLVLSYIVSLGIVIVAFKVLTNLDHGWATLLPGALIGALGWVVLQSLGAWIVSTRLEGASEIYGTFALVIVLLSWLYLQAQVLIFAAELNVVLDSHLWPRSVSGRNPTGADERAHQRYAQEALRHEGYTVQTTFDSGT